jgi:hypothetical protein
MNKQVATAFLVQALEAVPPAVLNDTWALYDELEENEQ